MTELEEPEDYQTIPNVVGMGLKDAMEIFKELEIEVIPNGKGRITRQSLRAGSKIVEGSTITLTLAL